jgi:chemotaxis protein histidine kinase CheA
MTYPTSRLAAVLVVTLCAAACNRSPSETEQKVAELEKQLEATKQELAAKAAETGAAATTAAETAAAAQNAAVSATQAATAAATESAENRAATERAAEVAAAQTAQTRVAAANALADQKAATAKQAEENAALRRQMEEMQPRTYTLPTGTALPVRTTAEISTTTLGTGATFDALLERDLVVDGTLVAKAGSRVTCVVAESDKGGKVKGVASMAVRARSVSSVGGTPIEVRTDTFSTEAKSTAKKDATRTGIAAGAGAVIGAIAGGGKGAAIGAGVGAAGGSAAAMTNDRNPATLPAGTNVTVRVQQPVTVTVAKE